jgi:hypothetical protein
VRLEAVGDVDVSRLHVHWNNITLAVILGKTCENVLINLIQIKHVITSVELKNKHGKTHQ